MKDFRYIPDVVTLALDSEACIGCRLCEKVCPHGVFEVVDGKARMIDRDGCMECGACVNNCPTGAVSVTPGVGCASYIIQVWLKGKDKASCGADCC